MPRPSIQILEPPPLPPIPAGPFIDQIAEALFLHDRDKLRDFDVIGYRALMYGEPPCGWSDLADAAKYVFRAQAVAIIPALRNPIPAMLQAGCASHPDRPYSPETSLGEIIAAEWTAMVDAALEEK